MELLQVDLNSKNKCHQCYIYLSIYIYTTWKKQMYIFLESGIIQLAYRHTEVWHTCLFMNVSSGQIYFVKRSCAGKINTVWKKLVKTSAMLQSIAQSHLSEKKIIELMLFYYKLNNSDIWKGNLVIHFGGKKVHRHLIMFFLLLLLITAF